VTLIAQLSRQAQHLKHWANRKRHWLYPILALALIALIYEGIVKLLKQLDFNQVLTALHNTQPSQIAWALLGTAISYLALIGYDHGSLKLVGARIPLGKTCKTAFMAYALGNSLGAGMLTGGALRMRHYTAAGATAGQVARAIVINALAFGLGIGIFGAMGMLWQGHTVADVMHLPGLLLQILGALYLLVLFGWGLFGHSLKRLQLWGRSLPLHPGHRFLSQQFLVSMLDILASGFALWVLLPPGSVDFGLFIVFFAIAMSMGVLSHVPGGLGVFEALMLLSIGPMTGPENLTAALVLFRAIYFLLPLCLALLLMGVEEWWMRRNPA
jgi:phosphatidylglycerol lysyltransferase